MAVHQVLSVLQTLSNIKIPTFLSEEITLLGRLEHEVQLISDQFGLMKASLEVVDSIMEDDPRLTAWTSQVREVAYDTEDVLDEFTIGSFGHRPHGCLGFLGWIFNCIMNLPARHQLATKLRKIKDRVKNISEARQSFELPPYAKIPTQVSEGLPGNSAWRFNKDDDALYAKEDQLVGTDKPKQHLLSQILDSDSHLKVIAVLGMGGIGKTTLVKRVHSDSDVENNFRIRAWVTVSQTYGFESLLKVLIRRLHAGFNEPVPSSVDSMGIDELKAHIRGFLQRARYMIVFDDVWHRDFWEFISVLPENSYGGNRVILTTRIADVASSCIELNGYVFRMEYLSFQESMDLLCRKTFKDNCCPAHLEDVVDAIVRKCDGLPLAIVAISGVLAAKDLSRKDQWERIQRWLGGESEGAGKLDRAKKILFLSYNDLPPTLKTCLLYTSIYPEDYPIRCLYLIRCWTAERFVEGGAGRHVEEVARDHIKELANRSLIQLGEISYTGLPEHFQIHDLFREIIMSEAKKINLTTVIDATQHTTINWPPSEKVVRRLVFHGNDSLHNFVAQQSQQRYFTRLRSINTFDCTEPPSKALLSELLSSKFLKVVDFEGMHLEEIPKEIFSLFLLTHLNLSRTKVKMVPKSIKRLRNLKFLDLAETNVRELPVEILKLQKLHEIFLYQQLDSSDRDLGFYGFKAPRNIGSLVELRTLEFIDAAESDKTRIVAEIGKLTQLRRLRISNLRREDGKELCSSLEKLINLQELSACSSVGKDEVVLDLNHQISASSLKSICFLDLIGRLETMPPWITNLQNLGLINLMRSSLMDDPLESLQHLPNLIAVHLNQAYEGESLCFKSGGFQKLRKLNLREMKGLRWILVEEGAMPHIKHLYLAELPLVEEVPAGVEHLRELHELWLWGVSSEFRKKLEGENEDYNNNKKRIGHIPKVYMDGRRFDRWLGSVK